MNLKFHPNASKLALFSTAEDNLIKLWDLGLECCLTTFKFHKSPVTSITFTNDANTLIASGRDNKLSFWNLIDYSKIKSIGV